jgi:hypothetical protein
MMAIAEHHPEQLYKENKGVLGMSKGQLHDFAATKGLKQKSGKVKRPRKPGVHKSTTPRYGTGKMTYI